MPTPSDKLWVIHIGNNDRIAKRVQEEGFICIGWTRMGDLTPFDTRDEARDACKRTYPDASDAKVRSSFGQPYRFAHKMRIGDLVVYPIKGSRNLYIGRISGDYVWRGDDADLRDNDYCNTRPIEWLRKDVPRIAFSAAALHSFGSFASISTSDDFLEEVQTVLRGEAVEPVERARPSLAGETDTSDDEVDDEAVHPAADSEQETQDYLLKSWSRTGQDFETVVAAVFRAMGYTARVQGGTHDRGLDVVAHPDPLGVQSPLMKIQVKSDTGTVGGPAVNQLRGLLNPGEKGILVGLGGFSNDAKHVQQNSGNLVLIDGERFVELFLEHYDRLDPEMRNRFPLKRVYLPIRAV